MIPYRRQKRRSSRPNGYVLLDRVWAERLGVQRTGGLYRIGRRELAERLTGLNNAKPLASHLQLAVRELAAGASRSDDMMAASGHLHAVGFYETEGSLAGSVRDFLAPALRAGDAAIVVATAAHRDMFGRVLEKAGIDLREVGRSGRYHALDATELLSTFMVEGEPDAARFGATIGKLVSRAAQGQRTVRIYGEMVAVLWDQGNVTAAMAVERLWNDLATRHPFSLFCAYPTRVFDTDASAEQFHEVCAQHSKVIPTVG